MRELSAEFDISTWRAEPPSRTYMVCSTPRSGSTLLCRLLGQTGTAGLPMEYFNPHLHLPALRRRFACEDLDVLARELMAVRTSANGCFGFKAHYDQFAQFGVRARPDTVFPDLQYVLITREDQLAQAISYSRAIQSGAWTNSGGLALEPWFDRQHILSCLTYLMSRVRMWETYFSVRGIRPLRLSYEQLRAAPQATIEMICRHLGVESGRAVDADTTGLGVQSDEVSLEWAQRIRDSFGGQRFFHHFKLGYLPQVPSRPNPA